MTRGTMPASASALRHRQEASPGRGLCGFRWLRKVKLGGGIALSLPAIEIAGAVLIMTTAYYGGMLVYDLGVNVTKAAIGG